MKPLLLGSKSFSRKMLLDQAQIPYVVVPQDADEMVCDWTLPLEQAVASIARHKMDHVILPDGLADQETCFVLTADTLSIDARGMLNGKPADRDDAIEKIRRNRGKTHRLATAFCVDRRVWLNGSWQVQQRIEDVISAEYQFDIPDEWIDEYLEKSMGMLASGAVAVESYGVQFLRYVHGSYSTIIGLPMYEVREALTSLGFFDQQ